MSMHAQEWRAARERVAQLPSARDRRLFFALLTIAFIVVAVLIVAEGSLSFLGLGLKAPKPTWGNMIAEGQQANVLKKYPFVPLVPGVVMFLTVYSFNRIGEFARSKWDPREAKV